MLIARGVTETQRVDQQTTVKDVLLKSEILPLLSRSREKSVSPEMWGIKSLRPALRAERLLVHQRQFI